MPLSQKTGPIGGLFLVEGIVNFIGDAATVEIQANGLRQIHSFSYGVIGTPAGDEKLSINEVVSNGVMTVPDDGKITITRTGAVKTADLAFSLTLRGI